MAAEGPADELVQVGVPRGAGIAAEALFRRLGLASVPGCLFADRRRRCPTRMFPFIVGWELRPSRLRGLRRQIFGLGMWQVLAATVLLTAPAVPGGLAPAVALVAASGFLLSSTAIVMQVPEEHGDLHGVAAQRIVCVPAAPPGSD